MVFSCRCFSFPFGEEVDCETKIHTNSTSIQTFYTACSDLNVSRPGSSITASNPTQIRPKLRVFTVDELKAATNNFRKSSKIGEGGFGSVYRGVVKSLEYPFDKIQVAVKIAHGGLQGHRQWVTEVDVLGFLEHPNLVKLLGYCAEDDDRFLVYEYTSNGSVADWLSAESVAPLSWPMRLKVARDAARALVYLHQDVDPPIIFRDFKPSNILLDNQWNVKLSDFGYARLGPSQGHTHVTTRVAGTYGYADPEYIRNGHLRTDCDVWSYGVFLYVLITGKAPINHDLPEKEQYLLEWVKPFFKYGDLRVIVDPRIAGQVTFESAKKLAVIAKCCLMEDRNHRPKMDFALNELNQLITECTLEPISPFVPILGLKGVNDQHIVSHKQQSLDMVKFKRKRGFVCLPRLFLSKKQNHEGS